MRNVLFCAIMTSYRKMTQDVLFSSHFFGFTKEQEDDNDWMVCYNIFITNIIVS
jgi:hypothetical protein